MKAIIGSLIGLISVLSVSAEPLIEGRVRLDSGEPAADAQVRLFDLTDLRRGAIARALTDGTGYFSLPLAALAGSPLPQGFALGPNYPNPFNPSTIIPYQLTASSEARLEVFNLLGQRIATLVDGARPAGFHTATWHATDAVGRAVGAGVYIYRMTVGVESQTGRMVLIDGQAGVAAASGLPSASWGGDPNGEGAEEYGLIVSGEGLVPYVDSSFRVEADMAPVELVVSAGQHPVGKAADDDSAFSDLFDALNDAGEEEGAGPSGKAQATLEAPPPPTNLRFEAVTDSSCTVRWDAADGAADYDVNYKPAVGGRWTNKPHRGVGLYTTVYDLEPGTEYRWAARAENREGRSEWVFGPNFTTLGEETDETTADVGADGQAPAAPTNLRFEAVTDSSCTVRWDAAAGATDYDVNYKPAVGGRWTNEPHRGTGLSNTINDLAPDTEYRWAVRAENGDGRSEWVFGPNFTTLEEEATDSTSSEGGPDLIVQSPSASAVVLTPGQAFTLQVTVHNQGDQQAAATMLHYYRSNNSTITASDTEVGTDAIDALDASATSAQSIELTASVGVERYYGACVASVRGESNTDNNCSSAVRITVDGQVATEDEEAETPEEEDDALQTLPPTWVFAGDVPAADRAALREEMEYVRTWFADQYGVEATGFTVLVGIDYEALASVSEGTGGVDLSSVSVPPGYNGPDSPLPDPFVTTAKDGRSVMIIIYGRNPFDSLKHAIAHEYFHVLQNQLAPRHPTSEVKPYWLVEGLAQYADYAYSQSRPGRRPFFDRYTPYEDLADAINLKGIMTPSELERLADLQYFRDGCNLHPIYVYAMAFAGSYFLIEQAEEDSYVQYWTLLNDRPSWQQAFEDAFGIGTEDFYKAFKEWLPSQLPLSVELSVWLHWPGKDGLSYNELDRLNWSTSVNPDIVTYPPSLLGMAWGGLTDGAHTITSLAGEAWTGYLSLWWQSDPCTAHLLGWYKDGELTSRHEEATLIEFTGTASSLEWTLTARPDRLPRLSEKTLGHCTP